MVSSAAEEVKSELRGIEGGSITLPDPVLEFGFLMFGGKNVATVKEKKCDIFEEIYEDRLFWNNRTGLFTLRGLQRSDAGVYGFDSKKGAVFFTSHRLTVYKPVAAPAVNAVNTVHVSAESCTLLCLVKTAEETTLLLYKDEDILNQSSSALSLPLTLHRQDLTSSYRCVAANPAEEKTLHVNVTTSCATGDSNTQSWLFLTPVLVFGSAVAVCIFYTNMKRERKRERETVTAAPH
uniref:uncharacterized protein n=1 Tax=Semicossyphus pulcher TaxID=241346 RepID=UPI0037E96722